MDIRSEELVVPLFDYKTGIRATMMLDFLMTYLDKCREDLGVTTYDTKVIDAISEAYYS